MIVATDIELRAGARLLLEGASFQVAAGDRIGLVGRNGAGKTTLAKVLAGQAQPASGSVRRTGAVGYLPQDPRTGDLDVLAIDRVLSARGLDQLRADLRAAEAQMADPDSAAAAAAIRRSGRPPPAATGGSRSGSRSSAGTPRSRRPPRSRPAWACPTGCCTSNCTPCPVASAAGGSWPGSCSPIPRPCCWTSRPTTWTPTRWSGSVTTSRATAAAW